jgi:hypothetical protein
MNVTFLRVDRDSLEIRCSLFAVRCSLFRTASTHAHTLATQRAAPAAALHSPSRARTTRKRFSMNVTFLRMEHSRKLACPTVRCSLYGVHCSEQRAHTHTLTRACLRHSDCASVARSRAHVGTPIGGVTALVAQGAAAWRRGVCCTGRARSERAASCPEHPWHFGHAPITRVILDTPTRPFSVKSKCPALTFWNPWPTDRNRDAGHFEYD